MCIRDSLKGEGFVCQKVRLFKITQETAMRFNFKQRRRQGCLLYTSDAADERSSVDLGGRRIIKKKKQDTMSYYPLFNKNKQREHNN